VSQTTGADQIKTKTNDKRAASNKRTTTTQAIRHSLTQAML